MLQSSEFALPYSVMDELIDDHKVEVETVSQESDSHDSRRKSWKRMAAFVGIASVVLGAVALFSLKGKTYVIEISGQELQEKLDARFPMNKRYLLLFDVTLSEPKVQLIEGSDRVTFGSKALVNIRLASQTKQLGGMGTVTTGLRYNADDFSFYLDDPVVEELLVQGIPVEHVDRVNSVASGLVRDKICHTPVYTLKRTNLKQLAASLVLKGLTVRDGKLVITLGI